MICEPLDLNRDLGKGLDLKLIACLIIEKLDLAGPQWTIKIQDHNPINYVKVSNLMNDFIFFAKDLCGLDFVHNTQFERLIETCTFPSRPLITILTYIVIELISYI